MVLDGGEIPTDHVNAPWLSKSKELKILKPHSNITDDDHYGQIIIGLDITGFLSDGFESDSEIEWSNF